MAITAPILFLFFFASVEFGRMNTLRHTANSAAYEAARCGIVLNGSSSQCQNRATTIMQTVGARDVQITLTPSVITPTTPELTVRVSVPANSNGFLAPLFFHNRELVGNCTLTREILPN
jgi:Flp pilus assembly protein TadG